MAFSNRYASIRYLQGLGSTGLYVRLIDQAGRFLVWANGTWSATEVAGCKAWLAETDDASVESRYSATVAIDTSLPTTLEYVLAADGVVRAEESFAAGLTITQTGAGPLLISVDTLIAYLGEKEPNRDLLTNILAAVSSWVIREVGGPITNSTIVEQHLGDGTSIVVLDQGPVVSVSSVKVDGIEETFTVKGRIVRLATRAYPGNVIEVTYAAGNGETCPPQLAQVVCEMAAAKWRERGHIGKQSDSALGQSFSYLPSIISQSQEAVLAQFRRVY